MKLIYHNDGDVISLRGIWTEEANIEAEQLMNKKTAHLTISGGNCRVVGQDILSSLYRLTKDGKGIVVKDALVKEYLDMNPDAFTRSKLTAMFADTTILGSTNIKKALHNTFDTITIPRNYFYEGQNETKTTIGRFIFNKYVLEGAGVIEVTGLVDNVLNKKGIGILDDKIGKLFLEDKITKDNFCKYIDRRDNLGYWLVGMINAFITLKMAKPLKEIEVMKDKLIKKHEKEIKDHDIDTMNMIEKELTASAKKLLEGDSGLEQYNSGELNFDNNYKVNAIMKGPVKNKLTDQFDFISSSFMDGIDQRELDSHANSILAGQYPASIGTKKAGYLGKKLLALLQMVELDEKGSDCRTKRLIPITITDTNKNNLLYSYIQDGNNLIMLDSSNIKNYMGKRMLFRSPMSCVGEKLCNKCAGELLYMLGADRPGLWSVQLSHAMLNLALKAKHDTSVNLYHLDPEIIEDNI